jgi:hypothetical protein
MTTQIGNHERTWTAEDHAIFVEIFVEDFNDLIANYVPAAERKAASLAFAGKATTVVKDYYETMESPPPAGFNIIPRAPEEAVAQALEQFRRSTPPISR